MAKAISSLQPALHRAAVALDQMQPGAVVLDRYGHAWQGARRHDPLGGDYSTGYWYRAYDGNDASEVSTWELAQLGPVTRMVPEKSPARPAKKPTT